MRNRYIDNIEESLALDTYLKRLNLKKDIQTVHIESSIGRVTSAPLFAQRSAPHYNSAAMDGILVNSRDTEGASEVNPIRLRADQFIYVNTGNPIAQGYDSVIMIEDVIDKEDGTVNIVKSSHPWQYVRNIGEDIVRTEMIIPSNHRIRPIDLGAILSAGISQIEVYRKPQVGIIPTGSEIVSSETTEEVGKITDSNSYVMAGLSIEYGAVANRYSPIKDDYELLKEKISTAVDENDILVINAGSSAGTKDFTKSLIEELGEVVIHGIAIKPGKPTILGIIKGKPVIGVPGYPVSSYIAYQSFVRPIVEELVGRKSAKNMRKAKLSKRIYSSVKHKELVRVNLGVVNGELIATPIAGGAGSTMSLVKADGIGIVPRNVEGIEAGEDIEVELLKEYREIEDTLVSIGSHDIVMDIIGDRIPISSAHTGSLGGIMAIRKREAEVAPIHLLDERTGEYNISYIKKYFPNDDMVVIKGVKRAQGLMVKKGNPKNIKSLADLSREGVVFINRQRGSGTRILLDYYLDKNKIDSDMIVGYDNEYSTHMDIAQGVKSGNADVGLGVASAADALDLEFIELDREEYDFLLYRAELKNPKVVRLIELLGLDCIRGDIDTLPGYSTDRLGEIVYI